MNELGGLDSLNKALEKYDEKRAKCSELARPMAPRDLAEKCFRLLLAARAIRKSLVKVDLSAVSTEVKAKTVGIVLMAGNVETSYVLCFMPALCEQMECPYTYVPEKNDLGNLVDIARGCALVMIERKEEYGDLFDECKNDIALLPPAF